MKRKNVLVLLMLFLLSFNMLHAYVLDVLETHKCGVPEYVHDFSVLDEHIDGDICHMHAAFHTACILQKNIIVLETSYRSHTPSFFGQIYTYTPYNNFLKPPIFFL